MQARHKEPAASHPQEIDGHGVDSRVFLYRFLFIACFRYDLTSGAATGILKEASNME